MCRLNGELLPKLLSKKFLTKVNIWCFENAICRKRHVLKVMGMTTLYSLYSKWIKIINHSYLLKRINITLKMIKVYSSNHIYIKAWKNQLHWKLHWNKREHWLLIKIKIFFLWNPNCISAASSTRQCLLSFW